MGWKCIVQTIECQLKGSRFLKVTEKLLSFDEVCSNLSN
jgi:hypothetical protein